MEYLIDGLDLSEDKKSSKYEDVEFWNAIAKEYGIEICDISLEKACKVGNLFDTLVHSGLKPEGECIYLWGRNVDEVWDWYERVFREYLEEKTSFLREYQQIERPMLFWRREPTSEKCDIGYKIYSRLLVSGKSPVSDT